MIMAANQNQLLESRLAMTVMKNRIAVTYAARFI